MTSSVQNLSFDQRACFIGGQAKSGTTLLRALLDGHPQLLALPQDTDYFSTVLTKYGRDGRRAQFDYLTKHPYAKFCLVARPGRTNTITPISRNKNFSPHSRKQPSTRRTRKETCWLS